jgi:hypothetical protein
VCEREKESERKREKEKERKREREKEREKDAVVLAYYISATCIRGYARIYIEPIVSQLCDDVPTLCDPPHSSRGDGGRC